MSTLRRFDQNLIKLDLWPRGAHTGAMAKTLRSDAVADVLVQRGWTQAYLAKSVGVSAQTVTNWLKGKDFPRPSALLSLAVTLGLGFDKLVVQEDRAEPVIAFRKKAGAKTTERHLSHAREMGYLLKPLIALLPDRRQLRTLITSPSCEYGRLRTAVEQTRRELGIGPVAVLSYSHLISQFLKNDAVLIPVLWGKKDRHENALHIRLPKEDVTFVYLNLDVRTEDFKFWMAHELAHVYTPDLAGTEEGEDFADAFAGAMLFPHECAEAAYREASSGKVGAMVSVLGQYALQHQVSLNTVHQQVKRYAVHSRLPALPVDDVTIHKVRSSTSASTVREALFGATVPDAASYIAVVNAQFQSEFFVAMNRMVKEQEVGAGYVQQVLDVSLKDSLSIHRALSH